MDQSNTTQAYMKNALQLNGNELVEFATFYSISYAITIVPSQLLQTKLRPLLWLPLCEVLWGVFTLLTFVAPNAKAIYALRFLTGMTEASAWPGLVTCILNWYTPSEYGKRIAIFGISGVAGSMFLGILQAAPYKNLNGHHSLEGWQWLFIVTGCITIVLGLIGFIAVPDSPLNTRAIWLNQ
ncbi:major facilitator superfamily transporter [Moniliophthora roreri MCA 2997]|uniref:Major facilitator superfamily transporter n=1 Tax=Moniliophthora roreri (strain MCA 2997) TaxID=1381753 RepID=V2WZK7_MONRO|nr:major facilitator superfamily transporter [Moniliophthora roreri MCA 2997]